MMNRNRFANKLSALSTSPRIPLNGQFSGNHPSPSSVGFYPSNIEGGVSARLVFRNISIPATTIAKLPVMPSVTLFVIPWNSCKVFTTVRTGVGYVFNKVFSSIFRRFSFIGRRNPKPPFVSKRMTAVVFSILCSMPPVALLRAKLRSLSSVIWNHIGVSARFAFKYWHGFTITNMGLLSSQHMGSGSIAIACHYAGHHLTACEIDPDYYAAAVKRIDRETAQRDFFSENTEEADASRQPTKL